MKIYLNEITDLETELDFSQDEKWVTDAVESVDERLDDAECDSFPAASKTPRAPSPRPVQVHFSLQKVDDVVVISGNVATHIELICSRCANPFQLKCRPDFSALFCQDPVMAGVGHLEKVGKPMGQNKGFARHAHDFSQDGQKDLDITYLSQDFIDLSEILKEQLQFQIPFQPLCKADCKGMCTNCGADMNQGRCACAKITANNPFSVLRDLKV